MTEIVSARSSREMVEGLVANWDQVVTTDGYMVTTRGTGARAGRARTEAQTVLITAYATHVHETAKLLLPYLPDRLTVAHAPLLRSIFETTLTLVWVDEVDDGADALMSEEGRQRRNIAKNLEDLGRADWATEIPHQEAVMESTSIPQGRHFEQLAKDIAFAEAYVTYRALSSLSHPSIQVADAYVGNRDDGSVFLRAQGKAMSHGESDGWGHVIASCLVWSGYVANYLDPARTRRSELRRIAKELGVPAELPVRAEAIERVARQRRESRSRVKARSIAEE